MSAERAVSSTGRIPLLREVFGEPATMPESFARAVGPRAPVSLAMHIGPAHVRGSAPPGHPPPHPLPRSAPRAEAR